MKHLHFVQSIEPLQGGGLGRAAFELSSMMNVEEQSYLVTTQKGRTLRELDHTIYQRNGPMRAFYSNELYHDSPSLIKNYEIIHGHGFYVAPNWIFGREARRQSKPLVYHVHGIFEPWILHRSHWKKKIAHWLFENYNFKYASLWRALTDKEADQIRAQGITAPIIVAPNGIELATFEEIPGLRNRLRSQRTKKTLLFLGRLHPKKGLDMLIRAWVMTPLVLRKDWQIVIAGPDELGHEAILKKLVKDTGLSEEIIFIGSVSGESKLRILAEAEGFVLPSYSEGFSVAILEAMACRLPVIATRACNFPSLAIDGGGWCVDVSLEGIKEGLRLFLTSSDQERKDRGVLARKLVERVYTWDTVAREIGIACRNIA